MYGNKQIYQEVGGFDECHLDIVFNDVDFYLKLKKAEYRKLWTLKGKNYQKTSVSRGSSLFCKITSDSIWRLYL